MVSHIVQPSTAKSHQPYTCPGASRHRLGNIVHLLPSAEPISGDPFTDHPANFICKLPGGQLYFDSGLDVDDDGNSQDFPPDWHAKRPPQNPATSYGNSDPKRGIKDGICANSVKYIALPGHPTPWWQNWEGLKMGDGAVIIREDRKPVIAVFADTGPSTKIGEISVAAHRALGTEMIVAGYYSVKDPATGKSQQVPCKVTRNAAPDYNRFITIVFPGTRVSKSFNPSLTSLLEANVTKAFQALVASKI